MFKTVEESTPELVLVTIGHYVGVASYPGPFEKSEKRAWYPLFAHALN